MNHEDRKTRTKTKKERCRQSCPNGHQIPTPKLQQTSKQTFQPYLGGLVLSYSTAIAMSLL